ncbi:ABC transporter substrate-binding protein [Paenibacillus nanensis]|nr:ABC transporter substrate-binding protein [Paenibacillus nanensis]
MKPAGWMRKTALLTIILTLFLSACSEQAPNAAFTNEAEDEAADDIIELKGLTMGSEPAGGMETFYKQLDALTERDLGLRIRFDFVPWGDEKNQISRAIAAKEYDLYVGGAWSDYITFAAKNAFADLSPYLHAVPELVEHYEGVLDEILINGKLYGIPQYFKPGGGSEGMLYREDLRKQWGLPEIVNLATAEQYIYKAKEVYPDAPMINDKRFADNLWTLIAGSKYHTLVKGYAVAAVDEPYMAVSMYDTPEYRQVLEYANKWFKDGVVDPNILAAQGNSTSETLELMKRDKKPIEFNNHFGAVSIGYISVLKETHPDFEYGWFDYYLHNVPSYMPYHSLDRTSVISVGAHSKHVEKALRLIAKAHTDQTYYNLLQYGVEGEHYKIDSENRIYYEGIPAENRKPGWTGLNDDTMNMRAKHPGEWQEIHDRLQAEGKRLAQSGGESPYRGFVFDNAAVTEELANLEKVRSRYIQPLAVGIADDIDTEWNNARAQLRGAGMDTFLHELQQQLDAFAESRSGGG